MGTVYVIGRSLRDMGLGHSDSELSVVNVLFLAWSYRVHK